MVKLFWFTVIITIGLFGMQLAGIGQYIELILIMIIIDILLLKFTQEDIMRDIALDFVSDLKSKLSGIEINFSDLNTFLKEHGEREDKTKEGVVQKDKFANITLGGIEKTLSVHKEDMRNELNNSLDMMAKKLVQMENHLFDMKKNFSAAVGSLDDRLRIIEGGTENKEETEDTVEVPEEIIGDGTKDDYVEL